MKIALVGDSTTKTNYLRSWGNTCLVDYHGKTQDYDFSLGPALASYLTGSHSISNFGVAGTKASLALTETVSYTAGSLSLITATGTQWEVAMGWGPDLIVLSFGVNDSQGSTTLDLFGADIQTMLDDAKAAGIRVVVWNGPYFQWGPDPYSATTVYTADGGQARRAMSEPYFDRLSQLAGQAGCDVADTRSAWRASCEAGDWDLFLHRDGTYLASYNTGYLYDDVHQWIGGQEIIAATIADTIENPGIYHLDLTLEPITPPDPTYYLDVVLGVATSPSPLTPPSGLTDGLTASLTPSPRSTLSASAPRESATVSAPRWTASIS